MSRRENHNQPLWWYLLFYIFVLGAAGFVCVLMSGCSPKIAPSHDDNVQHKDSSSISTVVKDTTIYVPIPLEKDQVIAHLGDTSRLETSVARSTAFVGGDGFLHHSLENKSEEKLPAVVPITSKTIYTGVTHTETHTITNYVEVEKPLSWWKSFKIGAFWWLIGAVALLLVWTFRKWIFKI